MWGLVFSVWAVLSVSRVSRSWLVVLSSSGGGFTPSVRAVSTIFSCRSLVVSWFISWGASGPFSRYACSSFRVASRGPMVWASVLSASFIWLRGFSFSFSGLPACFSAVTASLPALVSGRPACLSVFSSCSVYSVNSLPVRVCFIIYIVLSWRRFSSTHASRIPIVFSGCSSRACTIIFLAFFVLDALAIHCGVALSTAFSTALRARSLGAASASVLVVSECSCIACSACSVLIMFAWLASLRSCLILCFTFSGWPGYASSISTSVSVGFSWSCFCSCW